MYSNCFHSKIVNVKQHRTEKNIAVVRIRDSLQTFIGNWHHLTQETDAAPVIVFAHGARIRCLWNSLTVVEKQHIEITQPNTVAVAANDIRDAVVRVLKINRLISFGIVQSAHTCNIVISMEPPPLTTATLYLTSFPAVMRHLLQQPCAIVEWSHADTLVGLVTFDGSTFNSVGNNEAELFCQTYREYFLHMMRHTFGSTIGRIAITLKKSNIVYCFQIELQNVFAATILLSVAYTASLCATYRIPCKHMQEYQYGIYEWLSLQNAVGVPNEIINETNVNGTTTYYNIENQQVMNVLYAANRQAQIPLFTDTQILDAMKMLQTRCDEYCNRQRHCDGVMVQFRQLPDSLFCVPSLFFLLSQKN